MPIGSVYMYNSGDLIVSTVSSSGNSFNEKKLAAATSSLILFDNNGILNSQSLSNTLVGTSSLAVTASFSRTASYLVPTNNYTVNRITAVSGSFSGPLNTDVIIDSLVYRKCGIYSSATATNDTWFTIGKFNYNDIGYSNDTFFGRIGYLFGDSPYTNTGNALVDFNAYFRSNNTLSASFTPSVTYDYETRTTENFLSGEPFRIVKTQDVDNGIKTYEFQVSPIGLAYGQITWEIVYSQYDYRYRDVTIYDAPVPTGSVISDPNVSRIGYKVFNDDVFVSGVLSASAFTGSLSGTSSWALNALTSSYVIGGNISGSVLSASYSLSSSFSISSSNARTASWIAGSNVSGSVLSSSYALSASYSLTSSYLIPTNNYTIQNLSASSGNFTGELNVESEIQNGKVFSQRGYYSSVQPSNDAWYTFAKYEITDAAFLCENICGRINYVFGSSGYTSLGHVDFNAYVRINNTLTQSALASPYVTYDYEARTNELYVAYDPFRIIKTQDVDNGVKTYEFQFSPLSTGYGQYIWEVMYSKADDIYVSQYAELTVYTSSVATGSMISDDHVSRMGRKVFPGDVVVSGSVTALDFTGSLLGTSSWAISSSNSRTASYVLGANISGSVLSSSYALSGSYSLSSSYALSSSFSVTASNARTASWISGANVSGSVLSSSYALSASYSLSSSYALTASFLPVGLYNITASTSNTASYLNLNSYYITNLTASSISASGRIIADSFTGSFSGSINNAITSSYALTSSISNNLSGGSVIATNITSSGPMFYKSAVLLDYRSATVSLLNQDYLVLQNLTSSFNSAFFNYFASSGSNFRAGTIISAWSGGNINYTEYSTTDVGNSLPLTMSVVLSGGNVRLIANVGSSGTINWNIKSSAQYI